MSFFSQNHTETNSGDWTKTKKTTRTIKHENFSKMKILKVDRWALSLKAITIGWSHFQSARYKPLKLCLICRCGLPLLVAIWQGNQQFKPCVNQVLKLRTNNHWLPILVAMHKWLPNLVKFGFVPDCWVWEVVTVLKTATYMYRIWTWSSPVWT